MARQESPWRGNSQGGSEGVRVSWVRDAIQRSVSKSFANLDESHISFKQMLKLGMAANDRKLSKSTFFQNFGR